MWYAQESVKQVDGREQKLPFPTTAPSPPIATQKQQRFLKSSINWYVILAKSKKETKQMGPKLSSRKFSDGPDKR